MKQAPISITTSGDNTIIPAVLSRRFNILAYVLTSDTTMTFTWKSDSTDLSGAMTIAANSSIVVPLGPSTPFGNTPNLQTNFYENLVINTSTNGNLTGHLVYVEVAV